MGSDIHQLLAWFEVHRRDLPWRNTDDPYAIWVSEVMLQQTQVRVVIPYYERWLIRFPTVRSLADAPVEEVLKMWEGLGYYSRARRLHQGARMMVERFAGQIPRTEKELLSIPGIGRYTAGAILGFAFHQKKGALDGNVMRVLARYCGIGADLRESTTTKLLQGILDAMLPEDLPWKVNEALIELGATLCHQRAECTRCPLAASCFACCNHQTGALPKKSVLPKVTPLFRGVTVLHYREECLIAQRPCGEIMEGLYEFPYFSFPTRHVSVEALIEQASAAFGTALPRPEPLPEATHTFTRFRAFLVPFVFHLSQKVNMEHCIWAPLASIEKYPFSSGHKRVLHSALLTLGGCRTDNE